MAQDAPTSSAVLRAERLPPSSEEAEKGVLGAILLDYERVMGLCGEQGLNADSFYLPANRRVYEAMESLWREGRPIDLLTVAERLNAAGHLAAVGGPMFLEHLMDVTPTAAHAEYYIEVVRQKHLLRAVMDCARDAERLCFSSEAETDADAVLGRVEQAFFEIGDRRLSAQRPWRDVVLEVMGQFDKIRSTGLTITGVPTGFRGIDRVLLGMQPGNMIILAARPSMGKTSLALNIAENAALGLNDEGRVTPVGIFSLEMSAADIVKRMICGRARLSSHDLLSGYVSLKKDNHRNYQKLAAEADVLMKAPIYLDDSAGLDIADVRTRARRMKKKYGVGLIIIDYLQLLHSKADARHGRQIEVSAVSGGIKAMAKELQIPVLALSQLSRDPEKREKNTGRPRLADLRDSGSLEQDADVVMLLRRPSVHAEDQQQAEDETLAIVDIAKNRNGPTNDDVQLNFERQFTRFGDRARFVTEPGVETQVIPPGGEA